MVAIISLLLVVSLSILLTRVATIALSHTGLSRDSARFQARSAFTGAGFTTRESESVVNHPVRRRIVMLLMLLGNAGIVTAVSSLILTFVGQGGASLILKVVLLVTGLVVLWAGAQSHWVDRKLSRWIDAALRRYSHLDVKDYAELMRLSGDYGIAELQVEERDDWLEGKSLADAALRDEGILVVGIHRADGGFLGSPRGDVRLKARDRLICYGRGTALEQLDQRRRDRRGDVEHEAAVAEQERQAEEERRADEER